MIQSVHGDQEDTMRRKRALQSFRICLDLRTKALGRMHPDVASVMHNIGFLLLQEGQPSESLELFRESLEIRCNTLGPNHHEVASSLRHIGRIYQDRGEHERALRLHTKAFFILQSSQRDCSDDLVEVLMGLGQAQHSTGCLDQALRSYEEAVNLLRHCKRRGKKGSAQHVARVLNIMGNLALDMSNVEAANAYFAEAATLTETSSTTATVKDLPVCAAAA
jgi:tetratricopeptide (TPR) repeat protein